MIIDLPVKMFPLATKSVNSGGMVAAVLIGLAIFMAQQNKAKAKDIKNV